MSLESRKRRKAQRAGRQATPVGAAAAKRDAAPGAQDAPEAPINPAEQASAAPPASPSKSDLVAWFEKQLDTEYDGLPCWSWDGDKSVILAANVIEVAYKTDYLKASLLLRGFHVLLPRLIRQKASSEPDLQGLIACLLFGSHYYLLRDFLYYTHNVPDSCDWTFEEGQMRVRFADKSIPRQYFVQANHWFMTSADLFESYEDTRKKIEDILRGTVESEESDQAQQAYDLIKREVEMKFSAYFSILPPTSDVSLGAYTYADFYRTISIIVAKALYHRYHNTVNDAYGCIVSDRDEFIDAIAEETGIERKRAVAILKDIAYSRASATARVQPMHYPLTALTGSNRVVVMPAYVSMHEVLIGILRVRSTLDPDGYLRCVAPAISREFVAMVRRDFERAGLTCRTEVDLQKFDKSLPDIDLIAFSMEPTLGFMVYLCEVKAPIPASWSKDHLRALNRDSVSKAFEQIDKIVDFIGTQDGALFLRSLLPPDGIPHFGPEIVVAIRSMVITSNNAGMFFGDKERMIVDYRTLRAILDACDGDVTYINACINGFFEDSDKYYDVNAQVCEVGSTAVSYDVTSIKKLLRFAKIQYRSAGHDKEIAERFIAEGFHPHDVLEQVEES